MGHTLNLTDGTTTISLVSSNVHAAALHAAHA